MESSIGLQGSRLHHSCQHQMIWLLKDKYATPRDVQIEAIRRSYGESGWAHFLDMRLGKTSVALNEFMLLRQHRGFKWMIVLAPNDYKNDWILEVRNAGIDLPAMALESSKRKHFVEFLRGCPRGGIVAVNYEALRSEDNLEILEGLCGPKTMIVADESIMIKGPSSIFTKAAIELAKQCAVRRCLTGKPITQGPHDLWAQLRFIGAISGWNFIAFRNAFCRMGGFQGKQVKGAINEERLNEVLSGCSWTARKRDWLKVPGVDYMSRRIKMLPDQQARYDRMDEEFLTELASGDVVSADQVVTKLMKLQQIASGFIIDEEGVARELVALEDNPKIQAVINLLENELTSKVIIFYHFRHSGAALRLALNRFNTAWIGSAELDVIGEKEKFTNDPTCRVMLAQIKAAKYGHNLMASESDPCFTSVFYENTYSLDDRSQAEERNQGAGQQCPVTVIDFIAAKRDEAVIESLRRKEDVAASVLRYARETGVLPRLEEVAP